MNAFSVGNLSVAFLGTFLGIVFGAIPGVGPTEGVALLVPFTYAMNPAQALIFLGSTYQGGTYGGQIAAILYKIPGSSEAICTVLDGYTMAQKGEAGRALSLGLISSVFGGLIGVLALIFITPFLANVALSFSPAEYFGLGVLGLSAISGIGQFPVKGVITALLGLLIATIGIDSISGTIRFAFGSAFFMSGIPLVPALIGLFAASEVFYNVGERIWLRTKKKGSSQDDRINITSMLEILQYKWTILRSTVIGVIIGVLPGVGATTAGILSYNSELRINSQPDEFGKGKAEGIVAPEVANNAAVGGAMVPLLSLGIPGSGTTAVMLAAFLIHGLRPGPLLMIEQPELVYTLFGGMLIGVAALFIVATLLVKVFVKTLSLPYEILALVILSFCVIGSLVVSGSVHGVWIMFLFGVIGYLMRLFDYPTAPMLIGLVLGPIMEPALRRALLMNGGSLYAVVMRPITLACLVLSVVVFFYPYISNLWKCRLKNGG